MTRLKKSHILVESSMTEHDYYADALPAFFQPPIDTFFSDIGCSDSKDYQDSVLTAKTINISYRFNTDDS